MTTKKEDLLISVIIPYHNTLDLTKELLNILMPQLTNKCEVIIIDDDVDTLELDEYSCSKIKVIHHEANSGCAGKPRNTGLDQAQGKYVAFIDSDDLISDNYIDQALEAFKSDRDYYKLSWGSFGSCVYHCIARDLPIWNCSCWSRIIKREHIKHKFDEQLKKAEDHKFLIENITPEMTVGYIDDEIYKYRTGRPGNLMSMSD